MPFIAYGGARPSAGLKRVCSRLFNETISHPPTRWPQDHGPTNVGAMVKNAAFNVSGILTTEICLITFEKPKRE